MKNDFYSCEMYLDTNFRLLPPDCRLITALAQLKDIIRQSAQYLLTPDPSAYSQTDAVPMFDVVSQREVLIIVLYQPHKYDRVDSWPITSLSLW